MAAPREQEQWEQDALDAGMDPAELEKRRDQIAAVHDAAEKLQAAIERQATFAALLLEGNTFEDDQRVSGWQDADSEYLGAFRAEVVRSARLVGEQDPSLRAGARSLEQTAKRQRRKQQKGRR